MNIKAKINARKILLVYFYEQYFFMLAGEKKSLIDGIDKIQKVVANPSDESELDIDVSEVFKGDYFGDFDAEIAYIVENYFGKFDAADIDFDYIKHVGPKFRESIDAVRTQVNEFATTFGYDEMDIMDRVIFILWYIEFHTCDVPKEVVLNEMVELAKRYWDEASPKLINGIWHKMFATVSTT